MVIDILKNFDPETLRFFIVETHYRSPLDFSDARLNEAKKSLTRLRNAKEVLGELVMKMSAGPTQRSLALRKEVTELREKFMEAMRDDFNTALAISYMFELAKKVNAYKAELGEGKPDGKLVDQMQKVFAEMCSVIGILETKEGIADKTAAQKEADPEAAEIEAAIAKRAEAKKNKDYKLADQIRAELATKGIILQDTPQGVKWTRA